MSANENNAISGTSERRVRAVGSENGASDRDGRRRLIKAGALLVPAILTLRATPAWAQTDYTKTAYRYGTNQGLCRNAKFNPNAAPGSTAGTEFIPCDPPGNRSNRTPDPDFSNDPGSTVNFSR